MRFQLVVFFLLINGVFGSETRFSNIECRLLDSSYAIFKKCDLKMLGRGIVGLSVHATLLKGAFNNALVNLSLLRKFNGYRPFMFNTTFDFCKFMEKGKQKISFVTLVMDPLMKNSNLNHTCPYNHDIIVRNMVFDQAFLKYIPMPSGEYKLQIMAATNREWKAIIAVQILHKEDLLNSK